MEIEGRVGLNVGATVGSEEAPALGDGCAIIIQDSWGKFGIAGRQGYVFSSSVAPAGITVASTHVTPLAAGTGTPIISIWNPPGSGVMAHIIRAKVWSNSGTPGVGPFVWNGCTSPAISVDGVLGANHQSFLLNSSCRVFSNTATTGSKVGVLLRACAQANFAAALAAGAGNLASEEYAEGDLVAVPGALVALAAPSAGTSWVVGASLTWVEVPATT